MESKIEKAKQVFRKMLVDEYGINQLTSFSLPKARQWLKYTRV